MRNTLSRNRVYSAIVAVWLTLSMGSVVLSAVTWWQLSKRLEETRRSVEIQDAVDAILKLLLDGETSQRGFTLTGNDTFLEPLLMSEPQLEERFAKLTSLVRDDSALLEKAMQLRAHAQILLNHHSQIVKTRRELGSPAAAAMVDRGEGKRVMDAVRGMVTAIKMQRGTLISDDGADQRSQLLRASVTGLVAGAIGIGAGMFALYLALAAIRHQRRERELVEAKLAAERSDREKTVFLANMSHEIRTPMNAILGFCELLQGELTQPKHRQYVKSIRTSGQSLLQLIHDILDMSKIEAGVMEVKVEPTDLREICEFTRTVFAEPVARKGVAFRFEVAEDLPRTVLIDRIRLRQILVNLVGNAVKFTDQGEICVRFAWRPEEQSSQIHLHIEVQDSGVGIPRDRLDAVFKPFVQAGLQRDKESQGTGLGLSIVKRLTEMMGGDVTASSVPGQGSTFRLWIPHVHLSARLAASDQFESDEPVDFDELQPAHLLVVDDNEANCQLMAGLFADTRHRVAFATNGREAVLKADQLRPDMIFMDLRMPVMDGRAALAEIRRVKGLELTPVIAVTASSVMSAATALVDSFSGYIRKPFSKRDLFHEMAQFLPRTGVRAGSVDVVAESAWEGTGGEPAAPELMEALLRLRDGTWSRLQDSPSVQECRTFAESLHRLAREYRAELLDDYSRDLARDAENYDVQNLETRLRKFPNLLTRLQAARDS